MELRRYFSLLAFIKLFNLLEKLQGKMINGEMIWDFSFSTWTLEWRSQIFQTEIQKKRMNEAETKRWGREREVAFLRKEFHFKLLNFF